MNEDAVEFKIELKALLTAAQEILEFAEAKPVVDLAGLVKGDKRAQSAMLLEVMAGSVAMKIAISAKVDRREIVLDMFVRTVRRFLKTLDVLVEEPER